MPRLRMKFAYDGTDYWGWQKQPLQSETIQNTMEECLQKLLNQKVKLVASGRTDRGVHAWAQNAHFDFSGDPEKISLKLRLRKTLPKAIGLRALYLAPDDFHSQISAQEKTYIYRISQKKTYSPFLHRWSLHYPHFLDLDALNLASERCLGEHDFASFQSSGTEVSSTVRQITEIRWQRTARGLLVMRVTGSGFLKQMVRNLVGTLLEHSKKNLGPDEMRKVLEAQDRQAAGAPAPAQGLCLLGVKYPGMLDNKCRKL